MEFKSRSPTAKTCDSCNTIPATVFCRADSAFLCAACDIKIHAANVLASRHARVWICEVCEQSPSAFTCKADAAVLCAACDHDIHTANPLARRHQRLPVIPFYDSASAEKSDCGGEFSDEKEAEEQTVASWLLPNLNSKTDPDYMSVEYLFSDEDSYLDLDSMYGYEQKPKIVNEEQKQYFSDGVVPENREFESGQILGSVVDGFPTCDLDSPGSKLFVYGFNSQSIAQSVSSSSLDVEVVHEDSSPTADITNAFLPFDAAPIPVSGVDREARVMRYKEKRKNRRFEKTIRYASRKAYAETRPRIKGRFAKRAELKIDSFIAEDASLRVVPSF